MCILCFILIRFDHITVHIYMPQHKILFIINTPFYTTSTFYISLRYTSIYISTHHILSFNFHHCNQKCTSTKISLNSLL